MADTKVKLTPMTTGSPEPTFQMGYSWISVPIPAIIMAFWIRRAVSTAVKGTPLYSATEATRMMGATLDTNMARTCCRPKGMAFPTGTRPSSR